MTGRGSLVVICLVALLHGLFFIWYQRPDWSTQWSDQDGYRRLGQVLAETGKFTRFPDAPTFVPEVLRTPGYPLFVAAVYRLFGIRQGAVAVAQTIVFVAICMLVYAIARRVAGNGVALGATALTALFPPIPYFGALVMTEVWTTLWFVWSMWLAVAAVQDRRTSKFVWLGVALAVTTLSRPVFVLFPLALAAIGLLVWPAIDVHPRPRARQWLAMLAAFAIAMLPWFAYNYVTLGRFTLSPAGGIGRGLWEGSWQGTWPGRVENELTHLADEVDNRDELDRRVAGIAGRERLPAGPMLEYVHQWKDLRRIWTVPVDPLERAVARVKADEEYRRVAIVNVRRDSAAHLIKRLARGVIILWAGEIPVRYSQINRLPPALIYCCWAVQLVLLAVAMAGIWSLVRRGDRAMASLFAAPIVYITAVHFPLLTEARQSLPAMPIVLTLAAIGAADLAGASRLSPARAIGNGSPQV